jgi:hypothetical protein
MAIPGYSVGTATLTAASATMTGQGTLWVGNVRPYDIVYGKDGKTGIVLTVDSNTQITLLRVWGGTTQAAQPYDIVFTSDDVFAQAYSRQIQKTLSESALIGLGGLTAAARKGVYFDATAAAALFDLTDGSRAELALPGAADTLAYSTGVSSAAVTPFTAFARSLLDDASAAVAMETVSAGTRLGLNGISPPSNDLNLAIKPGFYLSISTTANQPVAGGFANVLVLQSSSIVSQISHIDTVGSSSGTMYARGSNDAGATWSPWRSVMPVSGSNANGRFMQFQDGTMISWGSIAWTTAINQAFGSMFISPSVATVTQPATYVSTPRFFVGAATGTGNRQWFFPFLANSITAFAPVTLPSTTYSVDWYAVGRWN